jgi:hypothetical protein
MLIFLFFFPVYFIISSSLSISPLLQFSHPSLSPSLPPLFAFSQAEKAALLKQSILLGKRRITMISKYDEQDGEEDEEDGGRA